MSAPPAAPVAVDPAAEEAELRDYLGDRYDHQRLMMHERQLDEEYEAVGDEQLLYRTSQGYLYDLTAFAMSLTKLPYLRTLTRLVPPGSKVLDYGCGIGSDGLALLAAGYDVSFADFDNPSVAYLRWRLERRGLDAPIYDLDADPPPAGFDAAYSFDVIEHVDDPYAFLAALETRAGLVLVNFLEPEPGETQLHHDLPVADLLRHVAARDLREYRVHHRRSHLVAYGPPAATGGVVLRSRAQLWNGRLRRRLGISPEG
jgi:SAM-dependent methyltransferase